MNEIHRSTDSLTLLPCPFCGCKDVDIKERERDHPNDATFKIQCRDCEANLRWYYSAPAAARDWNTRVPLLGVSEKKCAC